MLLAVARSANPVALRGAVPAFTAVRHLAAAPDSRVVEVANDKDFQDRIKALADSNGLGIVDFTAKWCGPCKAVAPIYDQLSKDHPEVAFLKVDIDSQELLNTVVDHNPTFTFYKGANRIDSFSGARLDLLKDLLAKHK